LRALTSAAGAPVLTRNEARSLIDRPPLDSSDAEDMAPEDLLIVPQNVTEGGKPSPMVMPIQDPNKPSQDGDFRRDQAPLPAGGNDEPEQRGLLNEHSEKELAERLVAFYKRQERSIIALKGKRFDTRRWNRELAADLAEVFPDASQDELAAIAHQINDSTRQALLGGDPAGAFAQLKSNVVSWANDIDRARVLLVAESLRHAAANGKPTAD
jgi:hypothetical protein